MYSYLLENEVNVKMCKGIKKIVVKKQITHKNYRDTLFNSTQMYHIFKTIRSEKHSLNSFYIEKKKHLYHVMMIKGIFLKTELKH